MTEHYRETQFGFEWGVAVIERHISHGGYVVFGVTTPRKQWDVYVTPSGLLRVFDKKARKWLLK